MTTAEETLELIAHLASVLREEASALATGGPAPDLYKFAAEKARLADRLAIATRYVRQSGVLEGDKAELAEAIRQLVELAEHTTKQLELRRRAVEQLLGEIATTARSGPSLYGINGGASRAPGAIIVNSKV
ncbi:MAG: hypothetical protein INF91_04100 [Alphaproteobacteria bacterium]|nr:hypothetical protein [Alphaproteobacteria bacterium]